MDAQMSWRDTFEINNAYERGYKEGYEEAKLDYKTESTIVIADKRRSSSGETIYRCGECNEIVYFGHNRNKNFCSYCGRKLLID